MEHELWSEIEQKEASIWKIIHDKTLTRVVSNSSLEYIDKSLLTILSNRQNLSQFHSISVNLLLRASKYDLERGFVYSYAFKLRTYYTTVYMALRY